jgi:hypothetical protein
MEAVLYTALYIGLFAVLDTAIKKGGFEKPYYAVHAIHNVLIVYNTAPDVYYSLTEFSDLDTYPTNQTAIQLCFGLHLYHLLLYWRSFCFTDWLHHGLMIGIALPIGCFLEAHTFMGMSLFFTTGLPGGIDYVLLFANRNGYVQKETQKRVNTFLNVWIRSPGCIAMATLSAVYILAREGEPGLLKAIALLPSILNYWNGQYFMEQVVRDSARIGYLNLLG